MKKLSNREIEAELEREVNEQSQKRVRRVRHAVNPQRGFGC